MKLSSSDYFSEFKSVDSKRVFIAEEGQLWKVMLIFAVRLNTYGQFKNLLI